MHAQRALDLGARAYVTKDVTDEQIVEAVRTVAWGGMYFSDGEVELETRPRVDAAPSSQGFVSLSGQELRVMRLIYMGLSTKEIAQDLDVSPKTVSTYKSRIMTKLGVTNLIELIRYAESVGFSVD